MVEKPLIIKGPLADLSDLLRIARVEGRKVLKVDKVIVKPYVVAYGNNGYMVVVEPDGSGCSKHFDVGGKKKEK
jgi:hypothetical protein